MRFISGAQIAGFAVSLFLMLSFASDLKAQVITEHKEGDTLSGVFRVWEVQKVLFSETKRLRVELPLPEGEWTLRQINPAQSTHREPVSGSSFWIDQVKENNIHQVILIHVYERNSRNWNDACTKGIAQKMLVGLESDCFDLRLAQFMRDLKDKAQSGVREKWVKSGLSWPSHKLSTKRIVSRVGYGTTAIYHSITPDEFGVSVVSGSDTFEKHPLHINNIDSLKSEQRAVLNKYVEWVTSWHEWIVRGVYSTNKEGGISTTIAKIPSFSGKGASVIASGITRPNEQEASGTGEFKVGASVSAPNEDGIVEISVAAGVPIRSFRLNGLEQGPSSNGSYRVEQAARVGQTTTYELVLTDSKGSVARQNLSVFRPEALASLSSGEVLSPQRIRRSPQSDAVAIIIGVANYRRFPKAEFADSDARAFYDYARLSLGVPTENIRLLIDDKAESVEVFRTLKNWLPSRVSPGKTDVFLFYSGHGLPSMDGKSLYLLPPEVDRDYLERTAISQQEVISLINSAKPRSALLLLDSCYSGQARSGQTLLADARPISIVVKTPDIPKTFTLFSASGPNEISSSSAELKHGVFSFFLMKGLEGDADLNKDGGITIAELKDFVSSKVKNWASRSNRTQNPMLIGNESKTLSRR
jgi:hypothetical protein